MPSDSSNVAVPRPALVYDGSIGEIYRIFLVNLILTIVTLGIYRFWAITRYRRYFWSHFRFQNSRFEYTGRGGELFLGFLMALGILVGMGIVTGVLYFILHAIAPWLGVLPWLALYIAILVLAAGARYSAQRYRLSRTVWNGIRGGMTGSALAYGVRVLLYTLLLPFTLMQSMPWMQVRLAERRINAMRFGSAEFSCLGRARQVYPAFLATLLGSIVLLAVIAAGILLTFGMSLTAAFAAGGKTPNAQATLARALPVIIGALLLFYVVAAWLGCWYAAVLARHIIGHTTVERLQFSSTMTGGALLWLLFSNAVLAVITLGFGLPIVLHRSMRFVARTLQVSGRLDADALRQSTLAMPRTGEGMLQMLDHGSIF